VVEVAHQVAQPWVQSAVQRAEPTVDVGDRGNPVEVLRRVAVLSGGQARSIYAPLTVATAEAARALKTDPRIAEAFGRFALAAIGSFDPPESWLHDALSDVDRAMLPSAT